jgi:hypothetical protein
MDEMSNQIVIHELDKLGLEPHFIDKYGTPGLYVTINDGWKDSDCPVVLIHNEYGFDAISINPVNWTQIHVFKFHNMNDAITFLLKQGRILNLPTKGAMDDVGDGQC